MPAHAQPTWRTPVFYRIFFPSVGLYFLFAAVAYLDGASDLPFTALSLALGLVLTLGPFRPVVRLGRRDVYARGLLSSRRMPLEDVVEVTGGYGGLTFRLRDGRRFEATGVGEKMNITSWSGRRGKADSIADTIAAARERVLADLPDDRRAGLEQEPPLQPPPLPSHVKVVEGVGTAVFLLGAYLAFLSNTLTEAGLPLMVVGTAAPVLALVRAQRADRSAADRGRRS